MRKSWSGAERDVMLLDGNAQRAQLLGQSVLLGLAWVLDLWPLVIATGVVLSVGFVDWPRAALFVRVHERWVAPRLAAVPPADGRPPRFSAIAGAATLMPLGALIGAGFGSVGWAIVLINIGAMIAEAVIGRCAPCELFIWAARHNLIRLAHPILAR